MISKNNKVSEIVFLDPSIDDPYPILNYILYTLKRNYLIIETLRDRKRSHANNKKPFPIILKALDNEINILLNQNKTLERIFTKIRLKQKKIWMKRFGK